MTVIDARGLSCPEPVVRVQRGIAAHPEGVTVLVDAMVCVENIRRFATNRGYRMDVKTEEDTYTITLEKA